MYGGLGIDHDHEGLTVDRRSHLHRLGRIDRRILEKAHHAGDCVAAVQENCVAVGLGTRDVFDGEVAAGTGAVFNDDVLARHRTDFFGEVAHDHVRTAARREAADEVNILRRPLLRDRGLREAERGCGAQSGCCGDDLTA